MKPLLFLPLAAAFLLSGCAGGFQTTRMDWDMNKYGSHQGASYDADLKRSALGMIDHDNGSRQRADGDHEAEG